AGRVSGSNGIGVPERLVLLLSVERDRHASGKAVRALRCRHGPSWCKGRHGACRCACVRHPSWRAWYARAGPTMARLDRRHPFLWITTASWIIAAAAAARSPADALPGRAPRITEHPGDVVVRKHEPVTLRCRADAEPPARLSWFHEGRPVRNSATRMVLPEGQLFFLHVQHSRRDQDTGLYWCTATNALGEARSRNASVELA
ncbi:unnamed protein product, partial [Ixodes persulcatus]